MGRNPSGNRKEERLKYDVTPKSKENIQQLISGFDNQKIKSQRSGKGKTIAIVVGVGLTFGLGWFLLHKNAQAAPPDPKVRATASGLGDVDQDGWVSQWDIDLIKEIMFKRIVPTEEQFRRADINQDGYIDSTDISYAELIIEGRWTPDE